MEAKRLELVAQCMLHIPVNPQGLAHLLPVTPGRTSRGKVESPRTSGVQLERYVRPDA